MENNGRIVAGRESIPEEVISRQKGLDGRRCIVIVVGEASGDLHAAKLVKAMMKKDPSLYFCGIGGQAMKKAGVQVLLDAAKVAAVGVTESLAKLPIILKGMGLVRGLLKTLGPDLLVLVDFPDFNLRVAPAAKKLGIPVLYYISPQIWAWRQGRAAKLKSMVDHMAVILPFEAAFYQKYDIPVTFVGHPLLDGEEEIPREKTGGKESQGRRIALLPGSRDKEVERHLPLMLAASEILKRGHPELHFVISIAPTLEKSTVEAIIEKAQAGVSCELFDGNVRELLKKTDFAMATSGTVTLEAALFGIPSVIIYRVSSASFWLGKMLIKVRHIGLVNLIAGKEILPELIQKDATPQAIADRCERFLTDTEYRGKIQRDCDRIRSMLGENGASERTAEIALGLMAKRLQDG